MLSLLRVCSALLPLHSPTCWVTCLTWKASPFFVAFSRKTSSCPSAESRGFYWPSWGSSKSWKERGVGLSQRSFGRLWPRRVSATPTLELSGCFSRGKEGAEQGSLEGLYAGGVTESSSCCGVMFWVEQHFCIRVLWFLHSAMAWRGEARLFAFALCHFQNTFLTKKYLKKSILYY